MDISLTEVFYTIGIVVFTIQLLFFIALAVGVWYLYRWYTQVQQKIAKTPTLFLAQKILHNPMKVGTGMMMVQLVSTLFKMWKKRQK